VKLRLVVPGRIDQATGGYRYAARMLGEWRKSGHDVALEELAGRFPDADMLRATAIAMTSGYSTRASSGEITRQGPRKMTCRLWWCSSRTTIAP
jgi:hypothetical protein